MKKILLALMCLCFGLAALRAEDVQDLAKSYPLVTVPYSVPDNDQGNFADVDFRFAWTSKKPFVIAIQFTNRSYYTRKFKFAIQDAQTKKMVVLDAAHKSKFASVSMEPNSVSAIWSGPVTSSKHRFSLHVWNDKGDEFDKEPLSMADQQ